jgi:F0F1-type ATP synthase membrane subunit b/b'
MDINITIFVQIINFSIAYLIIRYLLLRPAVSIILQEEDRQAESNKKLHTLESAIKTKEATITHEWNSCQQEFDSHAPAVIEALQALEAQDTESVKDAPSLDKKSIEPITESVAQELTERLSNVR